MACPPPVLPFFCRPPASITCFMLNSHQVVQGSITNCGNKPGAGNAGSYATHHQTGATSTQKPSNREIRRVSSGRGNQAAVIVSELHISGGGGAVTKNRTKVYAVENKQKPRQDASLPCRIKCVCIPTTTKTSWGPTNKHQNHSSTSITGR